MHSYNEGIEMLEYIGTFLTHLIYVLINSLRFSFLLAFFLKAMRPSHLLDVTVKAPIRRIGASKAFSKKDIRNGEG